MTSIPVLKVRHERALTKICDWLLAAPVRISRTGNLPLKSLGPGGFFIVLRRILYILLQPCKLFVQHMQNVLPACIAVTFIRKTYEFHSTAVTFDRIEHAFALDRECTGVVVCLAMYK